MGNEFKDFEMETPSLTLEPDLGEFDVRFRTSDLFLGHR